MIKYKLLGYRALKPQSANNHFLHQTLQKTKKNWTSPTCLHWVSVFPLARIKITCAWTPPQSN